MNDTKITSLCRDKCIPLITSAIDVFHTCDQNHVTAVGAPYWRSSFATATVAAVDVLSKLAANLVQEGSNVQAKYSSNGN